MSGEAILAISQVHASALGGVGRPGAAGLEGTGIAAGVQPGGGATFAELVGGALNGVNERLLASQADLQQLAVGNVENLHHVMIRLEESRLSFQLVMQVRNRLLEAYQDLMRMQV